MAVTFEIESEGPSGRELPLGELLAASPAVLYTLGRDGDDGTEITWVSGNLDRLLGEGGRPEELTLGAWRSALHPDDREGFDAWREGLAPGKTIVHEYRIRPASAKRPLWVRDELRGLDPEGAPGLVAVGSWTDITERKLAERRMVFQALHDPLTGLPNRTLFMDRLERKLARGHRNEESVVLLFLDLDGFKRVNDSFGHRAGDEVLQSVAERLRGCLREEDSVARFGGDEFAVLLGEEGNGTAVAGRIQEALSVPFDVPDGEIELGCSIGIAGSGAETDSEALLRYADIALYRAKEKGSVPYHLFDPTVDRDRTGRAAGAARLPKALERGEFRLHYQPIVSLEAGRIVGLEAMVRWEHPERGLLAPADFLAAAIDTGLIVPLGRWVLRTACRQMRRWRGQLEDAAEAYVSVNLSPRQLQEPELVQDIEDALRESDYPADALCLEVPEASLAQVSPILPELGALGAKVSLDDFGAGYTSLGNLGRLELETLKIEQTFVQGLTELEEDLEVVRTIVTLADSLGAAVVAEGVERGGQYELVRKLGCEYGQGHWFAPPLPPAAVEGLFRNRRRWR